MNDLYIYMINKTIKSAYFKAWILAQVRHVITAAGTAAIAKGYADQSMIEGVIGFATMSASFYLANLDVKNVDGKIKVALGTPIPESQSDGTPPLVAEVPQVLPAEYTASVEVKQLPDVK